MNSDGGTGQELDGFGVKSTARSAVADVSGWMVVSHVEIKHTQRGPALVRNIMSPDLDMQNGHALRQSRGPVSYLHLG